MASKTIPHSLFGWKTLCLGPLMGLTALLGPLNRPCFWLIEPFESLLEILGDPKRAPVSKVTFLHLPCGSWEVFYLSAHVRSELQPLGHKNELYGPNS